jgi:hypothetical protein
MKEYTYEVEGVQRLYASVTVQAKDRDLADEAVCGEEALLNSDNCSWPEVTRIELVNEEEI